MPTGKGTPVVVRLQPDALAVLDAWIDSQPDPKPSRPEAIRRLVADKLKRREKMVARHESDRQLIAEALRKNRS